MQPNDKQKKVARFVEEQGRFWQRTNDINSPTHYSDMDEFMNALERDDIVTEEEAAVILGKVADLFNYIKKLK